MSPIPHPPIERSVGVSWSPDAAFHRFTAQLGSWWPVRSHSIGGRRLRKVVFEPGVGGRIYEEHRDGRRFQWGRVLDWDPPRRVKFTWHPSRDPSTAQEVEVTFAPEGTGTRLLLVASGWEKWGRNAARARKGYGVGWAYVLNVWAGRRTPRMLLLDGVIAVMGLVQQLRGGTDAEIARAKGEIRAD